MRIVAVIFHHRAGSGRWESFVDAGRLASTTDLIRALCGAVSDVVVATDCSKAAATFSDLGADLVDTSSDGSGGRSFHYGEHLKGIARNTGAGGLLCFGSGSGSLLDADRIARLVTFAERPLPSALLNNFYSCDFVAISGASTLLDLSLPPTDNALGFALADGGVPCHALPRDVTSLFDIDTPIDLLLLRESSRGGPTLRAFVDEASERHPAVAAICDLLTDRSALAYIIGRLHPLTWHAVEQATACRTAALVEGRGMKANADGRDVLLRQVLDRDGPRAFLDRLAAVADGAILDTRPLLAAGGGLPPAEDRFACDMLDVDAIEEPRWRAFAEAAREARIPLLLGGHGLVSGGLLLLSEACWKGRDLPRRLHPEPAQWKEVCP